MEERSRDLRAGANRVVYSDPDLEALRQQLLDLPSANRGAALQKCEQAAVEQVRKQLLSLIEARVEGWRQLERKVAIAASFASGVLAAVAELADDGGVLLVLAALAYVAMVFAAWGSTVVGKSPAISNEAQLDFVHDSLLGAPEWAVHWNLMHSLY
ncbi:MAG: hypothetical protein AAFZ65_06700, partial [Planctomycetota bacterium]